MQYERNSYGKSSKGVRKIMFLTVCLVCILAMAGCASTAQTDLQAAQTSSSEPSMVGVTVSEDDLKAEGTAVVLAVDEKNSSIKFVSIENGGEYSLAYDSLTEFADSYGEVKVPSQFEAGDVVDLIVSVHSKVIQKMNIKPGIFVIENATDYEINVNRGVLTCQGVNYKISDATLLISDGERIKFRDIDDGDALMIVGYGHDVYSIDRLSGNGYVRVTGQESFKGGWIEIGDIITAITDEMILEVPEGTYTMMISYNKFGGSKNVTVARGKETVVDISDLKGELLKSGKILFTFEPAQADPDVMIDGNEVDISGAVELEYGVHTMDIQAIGYNNVHRIISVGEPMASINITLEKASVSDNTSKVTKKSVEANTDYLPSSFKSAIKDDEDDEEEESTQEETKKVSASPTLYIDGPSGAEVYFDGSYKGVAPCSFDKVSGTHVITLKEDGYRTKHYTLTLSTDGDETYSFADLIKREIKAEEDEEED
ncbi:MAG: PEGA domain-containing protein [Lachnospiraceae bacterium]|nr:PEGA domain-containing protein [Lachnospiraceae bacterium]